MQNISKPNVVVIGGGTGLSTLLSGLKDIKNINLSAIVTVFDDGSSTGVLRKDFKIPAVGDLRQVINALSNSSNKSILNDLMRYRFQNKDSLLDNHSLGNLIMTALIDIQGDFKAGIEAISQALNITGKIIPVTDKSINIKALTINNNIIHGESNIGKSPERLKKIFHSKLINANPDAILAINDADYIVYGIGSLYTSIISNIALPDIREVLRSTKAKHIYLCNIMQQPGETIGYDSQDHVDAIEEHLGKNVIDLVVTNSFSIPEEIYQKYVDSNQRIVPINFTNKKIKIIRAPLIEITEDKTIRHNTNLIKKAFSKIFI